MSNVRTASLLDVSLFSIRYATTTTKVFPKMTDDYQVFILVY